jgi:hypothetical protein
MARSRSILLSLCGASFAASVLVACTGVATLGGVIGGGLSFAVGVLVLILTASTQTACLEGCLSPAPPRGFDAEDGRFEPCLSDAGPVRRDVCLTIDGGPRPEDAGAPDAGERDADAPEMGAVDPSRLRDEVVRRLAAKGALPSDVVARLAAADESEEV